MSKERIEKETVQSLMIGSIKSFVCKNCGRKFEGKFCPDCGQSIKEFEKPFSFLIVDLAGNIFAFDTRFWKTLINILIRPGYLTYDYLNGHRARYMPPFRFYIFISFIFFILLSFFVRKNMDYNDELRSIIDSTLTGNMNTDSMDTVMTFGSDSLQSNLEELVPYNQMQSDYISDNERKIIRAFRSINNNPTLYLNRFLKFISWSMFFLMPLYAIFLWLFYLRYRKYYYGHFIFSINLHAFCFIFFILLLAIKLIFPDRSSHPENYLVLLLPVYMIIGTYQFYKAKWWKTVIKFIAINIIYLIALTLSVGISFYFWFKSEFF